MEGERAKDYEGREEGAAYPLPRRSRSYRVGYDHDETGHLRRTPHGGEILRKPQQENWRAMLKTLQYLRRTQDLSIIYGGHVHGGTEVKAYAAYRESRRPATGGAALLGGGATSWFSRMKGRSPQAQRKLNTWFYPMSCRKSCCYTDVGVNNAMQRRRSAPSRSSRATKDLSSWPTTSMRATRRGMSTPNTILSKTRKKRPS
ncbi:unnamed protein product [Sphacelaria rigidula]